MALSTTNGGSGTTGQPNGMTMAPRGQVIAAGEWYAVQPGHHQPTWAGLAVRLGSLNRMTLSLASFMPPNRTRRARERATTARRLR